jgi:hypothetical protein
MSSTPVYFSSRSFHPETLRSYTKRLVGELNTRSQTFVMNPYNFDPSRSRGESLTSHEWNKSQARSHSRKNSSFFSALLMPALQSSSI